MPINVVSRKTEGAVFDLAVEQAALSITVKAGTCRVRHQDIELLDDQVFTAEPDAENSTNVVGFLARHTPTGDIVVAVDETINNGIDLEYRWTRSDYEALHEVFRCVVPAGSSGLDDVDINVFHLRLRPKKGDEEEVEAPPVDEEPPEEKPRRGVLYDLMRAAEEAQAEEGGE